MVFPAFFQKNKERKDRASTAGTFRKKFWKNSGKTPETLSERFLEFPSRVRLGCPKPYSSRHLRLPERFHNCLPPSTAGDASFFRNWFRRGPLRAGHGIPSSTGGISDFQIANSKSQLPPQVSESRATHNRKACLRYLLWRHQEKECAILRPKPSKPWMGKIANRQSLAFSERCRLSKAIPQFHVERMSNEWTPIARFKSQHNKRKVSGDQSLCFGGWYDRQRTLVIRIAAITLASDSAITIALFRPSKLETLSYFDS